MSRVQTYRNEENYCLPWEYDKEQLTIWQKDTSDDGNQENAEIANNVDQDLGKFIVAACNGHEDLVKAGQTLAKALRRSVYVFGMETHIAEACGLEEELSDLEEAIEKAGVKP